MNDPLALESLAQHMEFLQRHSTRNLLACSEEDNNNLDVGLFANFEANFYRGAQSLPGRNASWCDCGKGEDEDVKLLMLHLPCGHHVHYDCGRLWFQESKCCPECGHLLETEDALASAMEEEPEMCVQLEQVLLGLHEKYDEPKTVELQFEGVGLRNGSNRGSLEYVNVGTQVSLGGNRENEIGFDSSDYIDEIENWVQGSGTIQVVCNGYTFCHRYKIKSGVLFQQNAFHNATTSSTRHENVVFV
uniref:RING-type domain-containing protein n=1 Tax=Mucochytrium quahogii TaxID=96639 RepID=A0A7S2RE16_9STRA|mmetsp:Transcript_19615/g.32255  ORF Transcript_19615/g.32255 Transcript_19615/m.32255 type:complete len:246 (+) Transcript_19615:178-915(+)|eukprot:CAMPEP_0203744500 /NCGR_PEP_ID=MMETSP0098-20131031/546_1 /ASSEMBLY_ACC=CAM_ASM_000208 /TAXON_ID=96639 /ORGANISM=" , Strain NY0313808BC1" /LENGTH=245 /DNA_ID=CAMNT_0050632031 /DNA_START=165 /DNA_END=902 /DNA_ORIENTATION=-